MEEVVCVLVPMIPTAGAMWNLRVAAAFLWGLVIGGGYMRNTARRRPQGYDD
jgi:hypothetical protein